MSLYGFKLMFYEKYLISYKPPLMKKYLLFSLFLFAFLSSQAQITMLDGNPRWVYRNEDDQHNFLNYVQLVLGNDTTINGLEYKSVNDFRYVGLREDSGIVYIYIPDISAEKILYNFNLEVGDTMYESTYHYMGGLPFVVITEIDSMDSPQGVRRVYYNSSGIEFYEGIGAAIGLYYQPQYMPSLSGGVGIGCFEQYGLSQLHSPNATTGCGSLDMSVNENKITAPDIYPNPVQNQLYIETDKNTPQNIRLSSIDGKYIQSYLLIHQLSIDISILTPGMYIIQGKGWTKKIIKE